MVKILNRKIFILFTILLLITGSCYTQSISDKYDHSFVKGIHEIQKYVVSIESYSKKVDTKLCRIGTGLILNSNGLIVTRESVILDSDSIVVVTVDKKQGLAWIIYENLGVVLLGTDLPIDIQPVFYKNIYIESCSRVAVLGNSFGIFPSVMLGEYIGDLSNGFKKLSIFLAPGNTGSPVINAEGKVIGLITGRFNMYSEDEEAENLGVFMPIDIVFQTIRRFIKPNRGWIGITVVDEPKENKNIVKVIRVIKGSPADCAGLKEGDIIKTFQDSTVHSTKDIARRINLYKPSTNVTFKISRNNQTITKKVKIGEPLLIHNHQ